MSNEKILETLDSIKINDKQIEKVIIKIGTTTGINGYVIYQQHDKLQLRITTPDTTYLSGISSLKSNDPIKLDEIAEIKICESKWITKKISTLEYFTGKKIHRDSNTIISTLNNWLILKDI